METITGIYAIENTINGRKYIGQSCDIYRRFTDHFKKGHAVNQKLKTDIEFFGRGAFVLKILVECSENQLDELEAYYIQQEQPYYNIQIGDTYEPKNGYRHSSNTKEKLRERGKRQWAKKTDEERERQIKNNLCGPKAKYIASESTREKLRQANLGKKQSEATIKKRSESVKKSAKAKAYHERCKKPVLCVETGIIYESVKATQEALGISNVSAVCTGRYKQCNGFHFRFV